MKFFLKQILCMIVFIPLFLIALGCSSGGGSDSSNKALILLARYRIEDADF